MPKPNRSLTVKEDLPGGQDRLRQAILYVAEKCVDAKRFGAVKLNKIIWKADFDSFAARGKSLTGREYRRQPLGPVPREMLPLHREMQRQGCISVEFREVGDYVEERTIALIAPEMGRFFDNDDMAFFDSSIKHYWSMTGIESSDESHGVAWKTRRNGDQMPYELAFLSDEPIDHNHRMRADRMIYDRGWISE